MVNKSIARRCMLVASGLVLTFILCGQSAPSGCSDQQQAVVADVAAVASIICAGIATEQSSGLTLNSTAKAAISSASAACNATAQGTNLTTASTTAAIFSAAVVLQQSGVLKNIKFKAESYDVKLAMTRIGMSKSDISYIMAHNIAR